MGEYTRQLGVEKLSCGGNTMEEVLTKRWCMPSISIADVRSSTTDQSTSRFGPTRYSVVPKTAQVRINCLSINTFFIFSYCSYCLSSRRPDRALLRCVQDPAVPYPGMLWTQPLC